MFDRIEDALKWMNQETNPLKRENLDKIKLAMEYLGHPEEGLNVIQITGTNGKGSVTSFLKSLFLAAGVKVGTFTSPHIIRFNERISYRGEDITDADLLKYLNRVYDLNNYMAKTSYGRLTYFEIYTAIMFLYFHDLQPDVCLIEVGIGGLNDCTNVVEAQYAVLVTIALDHLAELGGSVEEVAYQKSGIIKSGAKVFLGQLPESTLPVIQERLLQESAQVFFFGQDFAFQPLSLDLVNGSQFSFWSDSKVGEGNYRLSMVGEHQMHNASLALEVFCHWMDDHDQEISKEATYQALLQSKWQGRMEKVSDQPLIYLDGAHNEAGLLALKSTIESYMAEQSVKVLFAGLNRKNQEAHLELLNRFPVEAIYLTPFDHYESFTSDQWQDLLEDLRSPKIRVINDWQAYLDSIDPKEASLTIVTGSLYFVSQVRNYLHDSLV